MDANSGVTGAFPKFIMELMLCAASPCSLLSAPSIVLFYFLLEKKFRISIVTLQTAILNARQMPRPLQLHFRSVRLVGLTGQDRWDE